MTNAFQRLTKEEANELVCERLFEANYAREQGFSGTSPNDMLSVIIDEFLELATDDAITFGIDKVIGVFIYVGNLGRNLDNDEVLGDG